MASPGPVGNFTKNAVSPLLLRAGRRTTLGPRWVNRGSPIFWGQPWVPAERGPTVAPKKSGTHVAEVVPGKVICCLQLSKIMEVILDHLFAEVSAGHCCRMILHHLYHCGDGVCHFFDFFRRPLENCVFLLMYVTFHMHRTVTTDMCI